jgi:tetratricopeptide (TPR) repeat protein
MNKIVTLILFPALFWAGCKHTEEVSSSRSPVSLTTQSPENSFPAIMIKEPGDTASVPLEMSDLDISVQIAGNIATTTMEITFFNSLDRVLEGQFYFPLGAGQTVSRFALEVNGKMREGVVVEKEQGRVAYESTVRQTIDPGLLEWVKGNNFKARIYPIPAKGYKRLIVAYQQELSYEPEGWIYLLPMNFQDTVDQFSLSVRVLKQEIEPRFEKNELANLFFKKWKEAYLAEETYENYVPNQQLGILIPLPDKQKSAWIEYAKDGQQYFHFSVVPPTIRRKKNLPGKIAVVWDHSHSASARDLEKELRLLDRYFQKIGNLEVLLIPFANTLNPSAGFQIEKGNWAELRAEITALPNDGATQLGVIDLEQYTPDEFLLFSDGNSNFGSDSIRLGSRPVYVINSSLTGNHPLLRHIADKTGGQYLNLTQITQDAALEKLDSQTFQYLSAEYNPTQIKDVYPASPTPITGAFSMSGKTGNKRSTMTLSFGIGDEVLHQETIEIIPQTQSVKGVGLDRLWAQKKLAALMIHKEKYEAEMVKLGKHFEIVTPFTSLIVLDRVEDYVEYEIVPPQELLSTYENLLAQRKKNEEMELLSHLDQVAEAFFLRKEWWNKKFKIPKTAKANPSSRSDTLGRSVLGNVSSSSEEAFGDEGGMFMDEFGAESDQDGVPDLYDAEPEELDGSPQDNASGIIKLNVWNPETPYTQKLSESLPSAFYSTYLNLKKEYASTPAFFLDVANMAYQNGDSAMALRILSNIAELELENHELLRVLARRLQQLGEYELAITIFKEIIKIRGEEPQSYRDLGLAFADMTRYQDAVDMLYEVVRRKWDDRFPNIGVLAAHEMNAIIGRSQAKLNLKEIDSRFVADLPTDIRVVLDWDADAVDMDLWVIDPRGEKCYYQNQKTLIGGLMSSDFTGGYGPEEFLLKKAMPGTYKVQVNYYGSNQQRIAGPTNIQMRLITDYGKPSEKRQSITLRLASESEVIEVGELIFE